MDQDARNINVSKFRARKTMLLIVTDVAAWGIDIPLLDNVVNFGCPPKPKLFAHRVGRAARAGHMGTSFSFLILEDMPYLLGLHLFLSKPLGAAPTDKDHAEKEVDSEQSYKLQAQTRKACSFKNDENVISSVPTNQHFEAGLSVRANQGFESNRLEAAVLDKNADDSTGLKKQKSSYHWDKWSKKYVKLNNGVRVTASGKIKTESGAKMKANKTGIYKRWKEQSHKKVSLIGTNDGSVEGATTSAGNPGFRGDYRRFQGRNNPKSVPNARIRSEIKDIEQVRKERRKKADRLSYLKSKPKKGKKKFGGKGKRGEAK